MNSKMASDALGEDPTFVHDGETEVDGDVEVEVCSRDELENVHHQYNPEHEQHQMDKLGCVEPKVEPIVVETIPTSTAQVGYTIHDFELMRVIGRGAYGKVFLVRSKGTQQLFAMKALKKKELVARNVAENAKIERKVLEAVRHPFCVQLRAAFQNDSKLFLLMDFVGGGELFQRLDEVKELPETDAAFYAAEITLAIEHLHSLNILFRDLKPENVMISTLGHVVLTDFGFAKPTAPDDHSNNTFCGTVAYASPEIVSKTGHGKPADWWSLGCVIYEMIVGHSPFDGPNRAKIMKNIMNAPLKFPRWISPSAKSLITGLLKRVPSKRLGSGQTGATEVKRHPFFCNIDWQKLKERQIKAPWIPNVENATDVSRFDKRFTSERVVDSPTSPHLNADFFVGFSYTRTPIDFSLLNAARIQYEIASNSQQHQSHVELVSDSAFHVRPECSSNNIVPTTINGTPSASTMLSVPLSTTVNSKHQSSVPIAVSPSSVDLPTNSSSSLSFQEASSCTTSVHDCIPMNGIDFHVFDSSIFSTSTQPCIHHSSSISSNLSLQLQTSRKEQTDSSQKDLSVGTHSTVFNRPPVKVDGSSVSHLHSVHSDHSRNLWSHVAVAGTKQTASSPLPIPHAKSAAKSTSIPIRAALSAANSKINKHSSAFDNNNNYNSNDDDEWQPAPNKSNRRAWKWNGR